MVLVPGLLTFFLIIQSALWRADSPHAAKVKADGMGDYSTDETMQNVINAHLAAEYRNLKSQLREWVRRSDIYLCLLAADSLSAVVHGLGR